MPTYAGIEIETPQEVLARLRQLRQQALLNARTPEQINMINMNRAVDLIFGNPEVEQARRVSGALQAASSQADEEATNQNLSDTEANILRWSKIKDAFVEMGDMESALKVEQNIQQQQIQSLELQKLRQSIDAGDISLRKANTAYTVDPETGEAKALDLSTAEGIAERNTKLAQGHLLSDTPGGLLNFQNAEQARKHDKEMLALKQLFATKQNDYERAAALSAQARENLQLTDTTRTFLQKGMAPIAQTLDSLTAAKEMMNDPEFMAIAGRVDNFTRKARDLISDKLLTENQAEKYNRYTRIIARVANAVGEFRHERFGGAVTEPEIRLAKEYLPDITDSPKRFAEKVHQLHRYMLVGQRRASLALETNKWSALTTPGSMLWDEETDGVFTRQWLDSVPSQEQQTSSSFLPTEAAQSRQPITAEDVLKRYRGAQ